MAEMLAAVNAAFQEFKRTYPEAANYFCFLAGANAAIQAAAPADTTDRDGGTGDETH